MVREERGSEEPPPESGGPESEAAPEPERGSDVERPPEPGPESGPVPVPGSGPVPEPESEPLPEPESGPLPEPESGSLPEPAPAPVASSWTGPAPEPLPDYYAVLGVSPGSSRSAIAEAYDRLSRELQPDADAPPTDPERMRRIDEAFDFLDDARNRAEYDRALSGRPPAGARRRASFDRRLLLAAALIISGLAAIVAAALVFFVDLSGGDDSVTTDTGLQYIEEKVGEGPQPGTGDRVTVHYVAMLEDGTVFDDTRARDEPFSFVIGQGALIPGWEEGISTMRRGGQRRLIIPPSLAYGDSGLGDIIPPGATLIFEVELLEIQESPAPDSPPDVQGDEITTTSGLKYIDIREGGGAQPETGQRVSVNYTGWLQSDGTKFDSSLDQGTPFEFPLGQGQVIAGWDEGIATMKAGGIRRLVIPPDLGYGAEGSPPVIPPNATLIFDVELLDVR